MSLKPKKPKKRKDISMFYDTPTDLELAEIITIRSPREASESIRTVIQMHNNSKRDRQIHLERACTLAANRAAAFLHSPELSPKEQKEMKLVSKRYRAAVNKMRKNRESY